MDQPGAKHPMFMLPEEIWIKIQDLMSTEDWALAACTCRTMASVVPRRITLMPYGRAEFQWLAKHWAEAEAIKLNLSSMRTCSSRIPKYLGKFGQLELQSLDIDDRYRFAPWGHEYSSDDEEDRNAFLDLNTFIDNRHVWMMDILRRAPKLSLLRLLGVQFRVLSASSSLKHLVLHVHERLELTKEDWGCLQNLHSLETLAVDYYDACFAHKAPDLDLVACTKLQAVNMSLVHPASLSVPEGCSVFMKGVQVDYGSHWPVMASLSTAIHFKEFIDVDYTDKAPDLSRSNGFLSSTPCPNLTSLRIEYDTFCTWDHPIEIGSCLANLHHLTIVSGSVHVRFTSAIALQTLVMDARESLSLRVRDVPGISVASSLKRVFFRWKFCCPRIYALIGLLKVPVLVDQESVRGVACTPGFNKTALRCTCGACYECLSCGEVFCSHTPAFPRYQEGLKKSSKKKNIR